MIERTPLKITAYLCPKCNKTHTVNSKVGKAHLTSIKLPPNSYITICQGPLGDSGLARSLRADLEQAGTDKKAVARAEKARDKAIAKADMVFDKAVKINDEAFAQIYANYNKAIAQAKKEKNLLSLACNNTSTMNKVGGEINP